MQPTATFAQWLKQRRRELDLTQDAIADAVGCSTDTVYKIEAGLRRPSRQVAELLAEHLLVPPDVRAALVQWARGASDTSPFEKKDNQESPSTVHRPPTSLQPLTITPRPSRYLPIPPTPLIGREREIGQVCRMFWRATTRLVTLTGPPGVGKTRLSLAVASSLQGDFTGGLLFLSLAPITDPELILSTLAQALGVGEKPDRSLLAGLEEHLRDKQLLLVLDNFEQVVEAAPLVSALLAASPGLKVLVTSRIALHLRGEKVLTIPPLAVPTTQQPLSVEDLEKIDGVALFIERAQDVLPAFALNADNAQEVAAICTRLEGLPLAIELAAAKLRTLTLRDLSARLAVRLSLLTGGPRDLPPHQQTLRRAIESSYDLLDAREQEVFRGLGVFAGSFTLDAALAAADANFDILTALVDQSLLQIDSAASGENAQGENRFAMLETIREYASEKLEGSGEAGSIKRRHAQYFLAFAQAAESEWRGPRRREWLAHTKQELHNLRAALRWARESREISVALRMSAALWNFWFQGGYISEGKEELEAVLALTDRLFPDGHDTVDHARVLYAAGQFARLQNDSSAERSLYLRSLEIARKLGNDKAARLALSEALHGMANMVMREERNYALAREYGQERMVIYRELGDQQGIAAALHHLGTIALQEGNYELARPILEESLETGGKLGLRRGATYVNLGDVARGQGDYSAARALYEESLVIFRERGSIHGIAEALCNLGYIAEKEGSYDQALAHQAESLAIRREVGNREGTAKCLAGIMAVWIAQRYLERAAQLSGAIEAQISTLSFQLDTLDQHDYDHSLATLRDMLDKIAFEAARRKGATMTTDEAVAYALDYSTSNKH